MSRSILHCDMNNFYASVECMLDPALKKYPVAVCGSVEERHGIVLAKNYAAKAFDVKTGDAVWQAKQKCKNLVVVPPHFEEYIKYSKLARSVYSRYTDQVEPYGMDECWLDISGTDHIFGSPEKVANEIRETIKFELGLTISVGVSFNKIFAKLGSDMKKPDAVTVIPKDTFREKIWGLPAADLYELFVKPTFGKKKLVQVKKSDVRRFYNQLIDDKILKPSTVDVIHNIVHQIFQIAVDDDMIRSNPAANMLREIKMAHGSESEKRKALTLEQEELFLGYLARTPKYQHWYPVFYIMANTGMRVGEITGLRWCDVDMENGIISVNHTLVYYNHRDEKGCYFSINTPKTKAGVREIPMTEGVKQAFLMEKEFQEEYGLKSVSHIEGYSDFVFINRNGEVQHQGTLNKALQRIMRDCNGEVLEKEGADSDPVLLPKFSCHVLRHTFATRMCESGLNVKVVQSVLGHADVTTTLDIYVTVTNDLKKREITAFETYLKTGAKQMANV